MSRTGNIFFLVRLFSCPDTGGSMAVCRVEKNKNYTTMSNYHLRDPNLSNKARGLLSTMLSLPDNWDYTTRGLARICKDGVDGITAQLKELEQYGYLVRHRIRDSTGRITDMEYIIYERPYTASPDTEKPYMVKPDMALPRLETPAQINMVQGRKKQSFYEGKRQTYVDKENWIIVRNTHEPIIDEEIFENVQQIANQRKSEYHERLGKFSHLEHTENILQGLVWCPNCQRPFVRYKNVSHGKKLWYTYICPGHADDPNRCSFVSIREDELNEVLFTAIQSQIQIAADLQEVIKRLNAEPEYRRQRSDAASKLETARRTLKRSQSLYDSLYQNYVEQLMTEQEYVTLKARYKAEAEKAEQLIAALEQEQLESKVYTAENRFLTESRSFMGTDKLTKEMASALVERIYVDADKNIDIRLRYRDEYMALLKFIEGRAAV